MRNPKRFASAIVVAAILATGVLASTSGQRSDQLTAADIPEKFRPFYRGYIIDSNLPDIRAALPYESITLALSGGMMAPGGHFRLTLFRNGQATLWSDGFNSFGRRGDSVGTVSIFDFGKVSHLIASIEFDRLASRYAANLSDQQTTTVTVSMAGQTISVEDYGGAAPVSLWSVEQALQAIGHNIAWKPK